MNPYRDLPIKDLLARIREHLPSDADLLMDELERRFCLAAFKAAQWDGMDRLIDAVRAIGDDTVEGAKVIRMRERG